MDKETKLRKQGIEYQIKLLKGELEEIKSNTINDLDFSMHEESFRISSVEIPVVPYNTQVRLKYSNLHLSLSEEVRLNECGFKKIDENNIGLGDIICIYNVVNETYEEFKETLKYCHRYFLVTSIKDTGIQVVHFYEIDYCVNNMHIQYSFIKTINSNIFYKITL